MVLEDGALRDLLCDAELLLPNDLAFGPDGMLWLSDSGIHIDDVAPAGRIHHDFRAFSYNGRLLRVDTSTGDWSVQGKGLAFANGLAFGPDGSLYVAETLTGLIHRLDDSGLVPVVDVLLNPARADSPWAGPDGMAFDAEGALYVTVFGEGCVAVVDVNSGEVVDRITTMGALPTNIAFGPAHERAIYVTEVEHGRVERHPAATGGLPLQR